MTDPRLSEQLLTACNKGLAGLVPLLLKKGASVNWSRSDGWTPLMSACSGGHLTVAQLLLDAGASVDAAAADGFTALMEACTAGRLELVHLLLEHGASISHSTPSGRTAVILASLYGHTEVVELLLQHHADCRPNKFTALHAASGNGQSAVVQLLLRSPVDAEEASGAFISACANGHLEVAQLLLQHGVSPCVSTNDGTTALMKACMGSHRDVAAELILHGASVEDALSTARRSKMPGVMRVLHRAVEEAMSKSHKNEARDLETLVQSIEGKKLKKVQSLRSHFSVASTSTALAASEGATESPARPDAGATEASPEATEDEGVDDHDHEAWLRKSRCQLSGASWFKPLSFESDKDEKDDKCHVPHIATVPVGAAPTPLVEGRASKDSDVTMQSEVAWQSILEKTAAHFPEATSSRLSQLSQLSCCTLRPMPLYKTACYTIDVLMEEPPSPI